MNIVLIIFGIYGLIGVILCAKTIITGEYRKTIDEQAVDHMDPRLTDDIANVVKEIVYWMCIPIHILLWPTCYKINISFDKDKKNK